MSTQEKLNYERIAEAINYLRSNFRSQPTLEKVADKVHMSPYHFQRMFTEWAGVSPKKFLQFTSVEHAKSLLKESGTSLFEASYATGLSGTGRLHDLFITVEGMTPGEFKDGGKNLQINYSYADSPFGDILVASTTKGICHLAFTDDPEAAFTELKNCFPNAQFQQKIDFIQQNALFIFTQDWSKLHEIKLHLKGTEFQLKVWETLVKIPSGKLATYGQIASHVRKPKASRAVGSAIGDNPVAYLIPCHRVIQSSGQFGQYHWGSARKTAIIGWEAARVQLK